MEKQNNAVSQDAKDFLKLVVATIMVVVAIVVMIRVLIA